MYGSDRNTLFIFVHRSNDVSLWLHSSFEDLSFDMRTCMQVKSLGSRAQVLNDEEPQAHL